MNATGPVGHTVGVYRARRHQRLFSALAFALLALVAELVGRSLASLGYDELEEVEVAREDVHFRLPREVATR